MRTTQRFSSLKNKNRLSKIFFLTLVFFCTQSIISQSIVQKNGRLRVSGNKVVNKNNQPISLAGNSIFWSNFGEGAKFYNAATVDHLAKDWNSSIVRASMGVEDPGGYITNPTREKNKVKALVEAAIANDIYVIIDWHSHNAEQYEQQAITFFTEMAALYGDNDHVIYEVYNEPIRQSWQTIKSYSEAVINAIRAEDPDNLIIVGSSQWSQKVVEASNNPIQKSNIAYTLHFYAGTHKQFLRDEAKRAMNNGIALFVTEWGAVNANGDGGADRQETQKWLDFMKENNISHANWSVSDKAEGASVVASRTGVSGLTNNNLTATGSYIKDIIKNWEGNITNPPVPTCTGNGFSINTTIQAEDFCAQKGIRTETTTDSNGGLNVGYIDNGDYLRYRVNIPADGSYTIKYRIASIVDSGELQCKDGNSVLKTSSIPLTNGWQNWNTITTEIRLTAGQKTIELYAKSGKFNINWFEISTDSNPDPNPNPPTSNNCKYGTPIAAALSSIQNSSYTNTHVLGSGGPDLSNVTNFTINWDLNNNGLYQFSINTNNGIPNWWNDLKSNTSQNFTSVNPDIQLSNTGFANLDGDYWVTKDGANFVMVSKNKNFTIYFSNSNTSPNCSSSTRESIETDNSITVRVFPVPAQKTLTVDGLKEKATAQIIDISGKIIVRTPINTENNTIDISTLDTGNYFVKIMGKTRSESFQFIKNNG
ncbi:cellulase family glycosylhydrolase [Aquimarina sp. RZ0]|uniref:cellulase family glycosylhydrolase n=1 Tax=Aquimarina sp. RZ0 TaxID=2607730 RepID=UPI0011F3E9CC|nr:cellulase family glycosylhydrolase [Aquimarina sp. RZ0]KAA1247466.1 cellulase family glycosylhydrolase [Aquimarina sp. RZ0]